MNKQALIGIAFSLLVGCGTGQSDDDAAWGQFLTQYAELYCDLREDCNPAQFDNEFEGDEEACKKSVVINENKSRNKKLERECTFDEDQASQCLSATQEMSCTEWDEGLEEEVCNPVWSCD